MTLIDFLRKPRNKRERKVASHARRRERERIIALLVSDPEGNTMYPDALAQGYCAAIRLIRENSQ